jgi:hypothetical protein
MLGWAMQRAVPVRREGEQQPSRLGSTTAGTNRAKRTA